jgi:hypothetical protein
MLRESAQARALFLDYMNLDSALGAAADAVVDGDRTASETPVEHASRFRWWTFATAAACLAFALGAGLHWRRAQSHPRPELTAAIESAEHAIAQMPAPSMSSEPAWMSPTASLLDLDLSQLRSINSKPPL